MVRLRSAAMPTWEYKYITEYVDPAAATVKWQSMEDGSPLPDGTDVLAHFQRLGAHGWELVSVATTDAPLTVYYWFKRPKS